MISLIQLVYIFFLISLSFSQINIQLSQSSSLAEGNEPNSVFPNESSDPDTTKYKINENIFDLGLSYKKFYLNTKIEYSKSPVFGQERTKIDDMFHSYYLEYIGNRLNFKLGNIYSNYNRGLIINTYRDESTDFDNSVLGVELGYRLSDWMRLYSIYGTDTYESRTNSTLQLNDLFFDNSIGFIGSEFSLIDDLVVNLQYMNQELVVDEDEGENFLEFYSNTSFILGRYISDNLVDFLSDDITKYNINSNKLGASIQTYMYGVDIYAEYVINKYTKLKPGVVVGDELDGSLFYASLYADIFNLGITYEYKRYDSPYYIKTVSSAPFVYKESSSVLQSRLSHLMNFVNETGHQFDLLYPINDNFMLNLNLSTARRIHSSTATSNEIDLSYNAEGLDIANGLENMNDLWSQTSSSSDYEYTSPPRLLDVISMSKDHFSYAFWPYRQFYMGLSGYMFDDQLDFNIGLDFFDHIKDWGEGDFSGMINNNYNYDFDEIESSVHTEINNYWGAIVQNYYDQVEEYQVLIDMGLYTQEEVDFLILEGLVPGVELTNIYEIEELKNNQKEEATNSLEQYIFDELNHDNQKWLYTHESAMTIPTKWGWNFGGGNSVLLSLEKQWREVEKNKDYVSNISNAYNDVTNSIEKSDETYLSLSYKTKMLKVFKNHTLSNTFTLFYNNEKYERTDNITGIDGDVVESVNEKSGNWNGIQLTVNFKNSNSNTIDFLFSNSKMSIFYGSQRGGLICANGVCAVQPEFIDGVKFSFSKTF
tara:strand:+ start:2431 stop:4719 length:2289 start_codon:yes stop_codon:yes gene_type:complete